MRVSYEQLRAILDAAPAWICYVDREHRYRMCNRRYASRFDLTPEQIVGRKVEEVLGETVWSQIRSHVEAALSGEVREFESDLSYQTGGRRRVHVVYTPHLSDEGTIEGIIVSVADITQRVRAEAELRESEARFRNMADHSPMMLWQTDATGACTHLNERWFEFTGQTAETGLGTGWLEAVHPDDRPASEAIFQAANTERRAYRAEYRLRRHDGAYRWALDAASPRYSDRGEFLGYIGSVVDIQERKEVEEALRKSRERFDIVRDAAQVGFWFCDLPFDVLVWDNRVKEHFWLPPDAPVTIDTFYEQIHPADRERTRAAIATSIGEKTRYDIEYRTVDRATHAEKWIRAMGRTFYDADGRPIRFDGVTIDITERRRSEDALREEAAINGHLAAVAKTLATELDLGKIVQIITDAATQATHAQFGAFFYNRIDDEGASYMLYTLSGVPRKMFEKFPMPRATAMFGPTFRGEGVIRLADVRTDPRFGKNSPHHGMPAGHFPVVSYLAVPVFARSGEVLGGLFFGHASPGVFKERDEKTVLALAAQASAAMDTARLYEAEQKARTNAERANKTKDNFLAALSHELRTPLTPVLAILSSINEGNTLPPNVATDLETVRRNVELETRLIDDLLDLTRITRGKLALQRAPIAVGQLVENALGTCRQDLHAKHLTLVRDIIEPEQVVSVDSARLTQVLWNLLKNAVKFTPENGSVTVRTRFVPDERGGKVIIAVEDTGIGLESDQLVKIFDAFEQGDRKITQQFGGLGLGLAISKAIVDAHGGTITALSEGLGRGSSFAVSLPSQAPEQAPSPSQVGAPLAPTGATTRASNSRPLRILLVEDHGDTSAVLVRLLNRSGHHVTHASSVASALEKAKAEINGLGLDLVVSDLGLPDGSGIELMRKLSSAYGLRGIALSGFGMESDRAESAAAGFARHLTKPVDVAVLKKTITEVAQDLV